MNLAHLRALGFDESAHVPFTRQYRPQVAYDEENERKRIAARLDLEACYLGCGSRPATLQTIHRSTENENQSFGENANETETPRQ